MEPLHPLQSGPAAVTATPMTEAMTTSAVPTWMRVGGWVGARRCDSKLDETRARS